jgi:hypothetical protein
VFHCRQTATSDEASAKGDLGPGYYIPEHTKRIPRSNTLTIFNQQENTGTENKEQ